MSLALIVGPIGYLLSQYLDTLDLSKTLKESDILPVSLNVPVLLFLFLAVRYVRLKLAATQHELVVVVPSGEEKLQKIFGRVSNPLPPIIIAVVLFVGYYPQVLQTPGRFF